VNRGLSRRLLGRPRRRCSNGHRGPAPAVALFDDVCLQGKWPNYAVQLQEETTSIAKRMAFWISPPQRGCLCEAVCARRRNTVLFVVLHAWAFWSRRSRTAESRFGWRIRVGGLHMTSLVRQYRCRSRARNLLSRDFLFTVTNIAHGRCRSMSTSKSWSAIPVRRGVEYFGPTNSDLLALSESWIAVVFRRTLLPLNARV